MKAIFLSLLLFLSGTQLWAQNDMSSFISALMSKMTLQEKIGQLNQLSGDDITTGEPLKTHIGREIVAGRVGSVLNVQGVDKIRTLQEVAVKETRLGIPLLVGLDVIHGYETLFPIPLGLSCTWDLKGIEESAHIAATEAGANGIAWTFSPMVDIALDARWGRQAEGAGEDPFLGSCIGQAMVRGYQGDLSGADNIMACIKHFALYGAVEAGREYNMVDMSRIRMYNQYFPPYKAAVEAGAGSVMTSFNSVDGIPASGNRWLMTEVLRNQWGFNGMLVTDYSTISEMKTWGVADPKKAAAQCLHAGVDMDMASQCFMRNLEQLLNEGKVTMEEIDRACRNVLEAKYKLGLFADPYKYCDKKRSEKYTYCKEHRTKARELATESFVLLRNEGNLLPLQRNQTIALIGPLADNRDDIAGTWSFSAKPNKYRTLFEAMKEAVGAKGKVLCTQGSNLMDDAHPQITMSRGHGLKPIPRVNADSARIEALRIARAADVIVCAMGEAAWMSGEGASRTDLQIPDAQRRLLHELATLGKPIVLLNFAGRATVLKWESEHIPAIMNVWFGSECADALCDVLFGKVSPSGHLTVTMPKTTGQVPMYYNHLNTGRPVNDGDKYNVYSANYVDVLSGPLYHFGYGLSYTTFEYGKVSLSSNAMKSDGSVTASVEVTNTGKWDADEVVQLYIRDTEASISRPVMELKGFKRIHLPAGKSQRVDFTISPDMLKFYNYDLDYVLEPGTFIVMTGPDSKRVSQATLEVLP